jgi:hypothetical protein
MDPAKRELTTAEGHFFAEQLADCVLFEWNLEMSLWMVKLLRNGSLMKSFVKMISEDGNPILHAFPKQRVLLQASVKLGKQGALDFYDSASKDDIANLVEERDRAGLTQRLLPWFQNSTAEQAKMLIGLFRSVPELMRSYAKNTSALSKRKSGPKAKILPTQYPMLALRGSELAPLIQKVLEAKADGSRKSVQDVLDFYKDDFPKAYKYLQTYIERLETALRNKRLSNRAKKLPTRAKAIADALSGAEYGYDLSTSFEHTRQGRRMIKSSQS